jgi:hypothetical protein
VAKTKKRSIYGVHPAVKTVGDWIDGLKAKTGRSLPEWLKLAKKEGPDNAPGLATWFKEKHGFGTNNAAWLAEAALGKPRMDGDPDAYMKEAQGYVAAMYAGPKSALMPLHDAILAAAAELGDDVKACPCSTIVPIFRNHVIAQIKPSTRTRIDLGLALAKYEGKLPARLIDTGGKAKKDRITHRIAIEKLSDVDADVKRWLREAYDLDA